MSQADRGNTRFPLELFKRLSEEQWSPEFDFLYYHQNIPRVFFADDTTRGLMIYHSTGMGKSMLAASIAMDCVLRDKGRNIIILLAKSLAENMRAAIEKYIVARAESRARAQEHGADTDATFDALASLSAAGRRDWINKTFGFVTMNASNMITQMSRASLTTDDDDLIMETKIGSLLAATNVRLDRKLLIIDEAHNFFRAIINGSRNSAMLYDTIMRTRDLKILFLTGTPIATHPFELSACFNMLAGETILPVHFSDFMRLYVNTETDTIRSPAKFQNRIMGLVSFVNFESTIGIGIGTTAREKQSVEYPDEIPMEIVRSEMTEDQYGAYIAAREVEREENMAAAERRTGGALFHVRETPALQKPKSVFSSSYRVHSRQIGNYCPPPNIRARLRDLRDENRGESFDAMNFIKDVAIESVKFTAILERMNAAPTQLVLVYSQFVSIGGLAAFAQFLDQNGYRDKHATISGEIPAADRARIIDIFVSDENMHGERIRVLLISATGAEGIDLKNVRQVHILETYWNMGRINQVKARAIRNRSHIALPQEERNVATFLHMAVAPRASKEITSDEELYASAISSQRIIESFEETLRAVSIECPLNHTADERAKKCRMCAPNGIPMYTNDPESDSRAVDPCITLKTRDVSVRRITIDGEEYGYRPADKPGIFAYDIFVMDPRVRAFRKLLQSDARYSQIDAAIRAAARTGDV